MREYEMTLSTFSDLFKVLEEGCFVSHSEQAIKGAMLEDS